MSTNISMNAVTRSRSVTSARTSTVSYVNTRSELESFIREENNKPNVKKLAQFTNYISDFNANKDGPQDVVPLVEDNTKTFQNLKKIHTDTVTLRNTSGGTLFWRYIVEDVEMENMVRSAGKYKLVVEPRIGQLKKGESVEITFKLEVFCTTKIYYLAEFEFSNEPLRSGENQVEEVTSSGGFLCFGKKKLLKGFQYLGIIIEGKESSSIDHDDLKYDPSLPVTKGDRGQFYKGKYHDKEVFIHSIKGKISEKVRLEIIKKVNSLTTLDTPLIANYYGTTHITNQPFTIVMGYVPGVTLKAYTRTRSLSDKMKCKLALDMAKSIAHLHSFKIPHKNIRSKAAIVINEDFADQNITIINVDIRDNDEVVLSYKNFQDRINYDTSVDAKKYLRKTSTTLSYLSPEMLDTKVTNWLACDVYAFGITLWEIYAQRKAYSDPKFYNKQLSEKASYVRSGKRMDVPAKFPVGILKLITLCWAQDFNDRPKFNDIVEILEKELEISSDKIPPPIPKEPIKQDLTMLGWTGDLAREEADDKLREKPVGTYLTRWSSNSSSYVLSFVDDKGQVTHIGGLQPIENGGVIASTKNGTINYNNLTEYVDKLKGKGILTNPIKLEVKEDDDHYGVIN